MADAQGCELQLAREHRPAVKEIMAFSQEPGGGTHPLAPANGFDARVAAVFSELSSGIGDARRLLIDQEARVGSLI